jgi:O-antigen/teichoic acid export membrane protein
MRRFGNVALALDSESILGIVGKIANSACYLVTALLTTRFLTPSQQGFFFTFLSFATLTVVVELGLSTVIIQFVSHELAGLETAGDAISRAKALSRLRSIGRFALTWFWIGALLFWLVVGTSGYFFLRDVTGSSSVLPGPWAMMVTLIALELATFPCWALLEGARRVKSVYAYRAVKALVLGIGTWAALWFGLGLWALPIGFLCVLPLAIWPLKANWDFFALLLTPPERDVVRWRAEILPLQWRLAMSWVAGYFANWAITPIALKMFGGAVAGQLGLTWTLATGITTIASSVIQVKFTRFGHLVATRKFPELDRMVLRQGVISVLLAIAGSAVVLCADWLAIHEGVGFAHRLLPLEVIAIFMLGAIIQQCAQPLAYYLRAFKREPYMWLSIVISIVQATAIIILGRLFGVVGFAIAYAGSAIFLSVPGAYLIFYYRRREWTRAPVV